jgi:lysylphosphatidylglycerol synthetase-like protein (DUF2156 family)
LGAGSFKLEDHSRPQESTDSQLLEDLRRFGDRTSSFVTTYPGFESFFSSNGGIIRYMATAKAWVGATEPIAPVAKRVKLFAEFAAAAQAHKMRALQTPVGEDFAREAVARGFYCVQVGSESIFDLREYFSRQKDPAQRFPHARSLQKRGAQVVQYNPAALPAAAALEMRALTKRWMDDKNSTRLHFLNQVEPFFQIARRKIFALYFQGEMVAFLSTTPIDPLNSVFFADYVRDGRTRAGMMELLFIESMRLLHAEGIAQVRLGTCLFANLPDAPGPYRIMNLLFKFGNFPLNFRSIYIFKDKFQPTRWEPVYLVTSGKTGITAASDLAEVIIGRSLWRAAGDQMFSSALKMTAFICIGIFPWLARKLQVRLRQLRDLQLIAKWQRRRRKKKFQVKID